MGGIGTELQTLRREVFDPYTPLLMVLVVTGLIICSLTDGFIFGQMSGMIDALGGKDNSITLTDDEISWIASIINITCFCGNAVVSIVTEKFGRRKAITIITTPVLICWIMVYFAQDKYTLLASRIIVGASYGGMLDLSYISLAEYVPPSIRSLCINLILACGTSAGTLLGHVLSLFLHWRNVALIGIIPTAISIILPLFWVESPFWLATKGRLKECETAFKAIRIPNEESETELKILINSQREDNKAFKNGNVLMVLIKKYIKACKQKYYWKILFLLIVICIYRVAAGRVLFNTLVITMLQDITGTSDILLFTLLVDGCAVVGACISCIFVSKFKMRTLLFTSGLVANATQIILALCLYIWPDNSFYVSWFKVSLLAFYSITVSAGTYAVLDTLISELLPLEVKGSTMIVVSGVAGIFQFSNIVLATFLFSVIGYHGVFFCNAVMVFACLLYLYIYLPETKGRTLQEIQFYFKDNKFPDIGDKLYSEHQNALLIEMNSAVTT